MMKSKVVDFSPPDGVVPEGTEEGEEFDLVCTFRVKGNGMICLVQAGDVKMPGYDTQGGKHRPDYSDESKSMQDMGNGGYEQ